MMGANKTRLAIRKSLVVDAQNSVMGYQRWALCHRLAIRDKSGGNAKRETRRPQSGRAQKKPCPQSLVVARESLATASWTRVVAQQHVSTPAHKSPGHVEPQPRGCPQNARLVAHSPNWASKASLALDSHMPPSSTCGCPERKTLAT